MAILEFIEAEMPEMERGARGAEPKRKLGLFRRGKK
jgi:hypothetical protein